MTKLAIFKIVAVSAVMGAALSANAFYFEIVGTVNSSGAITGNLSTTSSLAEFGNNYNYDLVLNASTGALTFDVSNGSSVADFTGSGSVVATSGTNAFSGSATAGTVANTSIVTGATGSYASNFDYTDGFFTFTLSGANPVPEPASMTFLGLGVAALIRRRRK